MGEIINKFENIFFRFYRILGRLLIKYSFDSRPASYPYITGDGFRKLADHIYDAAQKNVIPENVKEGDIIFVGDSNIKVFLKTVHQQIKANYVLITHNGDEPVDEEALGLMGSNIVKWYGINVLVNHPKVVPLPLGIANKHFYVTGITALFDKIRKKVVQKTSKIFYGFTIHTNTQERQPAFDALKSNENAETIMVWVNFKKYLDLLVKYKFVASPPGSSVEGHRTWDALYLKVVPIVKRSITTESFAAIGIPVWQVDDWRELDGLKQQDLDEKYLKLEDAFSSPAIFFDYWKERIRNKV